MRLQEFLTRASEVSAPDLLDAERRARIYGGSIDTALLELEVIGPAALDAALAGSRGLLSCPPELLVQTSQRRPWDMLPSVWVDELDAVPLAVVEDRLWIALHPEVSDEAITHVQQLLPGAVLTITAECWIRMISDQHRRRVTPPRYASLAARYLQAIRDIRDHMPEDSLTGQVTEVHVAFGSEASGFFPVDDDGLDSPFDGALRAEDAAIPDVDTLAAKPASETLGERGNRLGDPADFANKALTLLTDPPVWRVMSENAVRWAQSFSWEEAAVATERILEQCRR